MFLLQSVTAARRAVLRDVGVAGSGLRSLLPKAGVPGLSSVSLPRLHNLLPATRCQTACTQLTQASQSLFVTCCLYASTLS